MKLPITHFLLADGIYAIPGVSILFFLGYFFTDSIIDLVITSDRAKPIIVLVALAASQNYVAGNLLAVAPKELVGRNTRGPATGQAADE